MAVTNTGGIPAGSCLSPGHEIPDATPEGFIRRPPSDLALDRGGVGRHHRTDCSAAAFFTRVRPAENGSLRTFFVSSVGTTAAGASLIQSLGCHGPPRAASRLFPGLIRTMPNWITSEPPTVRELSRSARIQMLHELKIPSALLPDSLFQW